MTLLASTNPSRSYATIGSVETTSPEELNALYLDARRAAPIWANTNITERVRMLRGLFDIFLSEKESLAHSVALEMGMPIRLARDEVQYGLNYFSWYLDHAEEMLSPKITYETDTEIHTVFYEPKGVIAAITPWNYPFMLFVWACMQPLLAGNTVLWKISKEVILTGKLIAELVARSGLPKGVWAEVSGDGKLGDMMTDLPIDGITFTGSTNVGESLRAKAYAKNIPAIMELGGSAPGIVCEDADIDSVLESIYFMRFSNSGQMCDGLKRLIVHASRYDELVVKLAERLQSKKLGDALDEESDIGPLVSEKQLESVHAQYLDALTKGAHVLGELMPTPDMEGAYHSAVLFGGVTRDMSLWNEEVFGPLLPVMRYETIEEAIELANDTIYGLGGYVFTESHETFRMIARSLHTGNVQMNNVNYCLPPTPFGGYKASGIGREHGEWGFHELCNIKGISEPK